MNKREVEKLTSRIAEVISNSTDATYAGEVMGIREASEQIVEFLQIEKRHRIRANSRLVKKCSIHDYQPTFQGGDTYKCELCGKEIDMTEDDF